VTSLGIEIVDLTEFVGDFQIPCEYAGEPGCQDEPAAWVLHLKPCCPAGGGIRLACERCKESRLMDMHSVQCEFCGHIFEHAPEAYRLIEPLERK
jgi:hypothetical protein